jgi:hypothetical protein
MSEEEYEATFIEHLSKTYLNISVEGINTRTKCAGSIDTLAFILAQSARQDKDIRKALEIALRFLKATKL